MYVSSCPCFTHASPAPPTLLTAVLKEPANIIAGKTLLLDEKILVYFFSPSYFYICILPTASSVLEAKQLLIKQSPVCMDKSVSSPSGRDVNAHKHFLELTGPQKVKITYSCQVLDAKLSDSS